MNAIIDRLSVPGGPGITGNLLDAEGFPRADIDIQAVRSDRRRLAELRNDHKDITKRIEQNLEVLHSAGVGQKSAPSLGVTSSSLHDFVAMEVDPIGKVPFAMIDEITDASPASDDGLQLGDQIVKFGSVELGDQLLSRLAAEAQLNLGHPVHVMLMRNGSIINLTVTPRQWQGRGLLGCHFRILQR